jgi:pimeloyl-ACP methyl ester carboxylesterase
VHTPALPGFTRPPPPNFKPTKENYTDWLIAEIEKLHNDLGPIDLVGHDWGALLSLRAASLRPNLIRSWAVSGAVIHQDYRGHSTARQWATPLLGEGIMALTTARLLEKALIAGGMPMQIARSEVKHWNRAKRQCILTLYRSAKGLRFTGDWLTDLKNLPARGLVLWGENDPYVDTTFGRSFAAQQSVPFYVIKKTGHWVIAEKPEAVLPHLCALWDF